MWPIVIALAAGLMPRAEDLHRNHSNACRTPQNTLCRTIRLEISGWENVSWGLHAVRRWNGKAVLSYRQDGGILERYVQKSYRNYFWPDQSWDRASIRLPSERRTIDIDHLSREYRLSSFAGGSPTWDAADTDCSKMAAAFLLKNLERIGEATIAGVRSVGFTGLRSKNDRSYVWLAPTIGCTQMRVIQYVENSFGLPTSHSRSEVISIEVGEPDAALFQAPAGYRQTQ